MLLHLVASSLFVIMGAKSAAYLVLYRRFVKHGIEVEASVESLGRFSYLLNARVPYLHFITLGSMPVNGKPIHSWFIAGSNYRPGMQCTILYNEEEPTLFIVKSRRELRINLLYVFIALVYLTGGVLEALHII